MHWLPVLLVALGLTSRRRRVSEPKRLYARRKLFRGRLLDTCAAPPKYVLRGTRAPCPSPPPLPYGLQRPYL